MYIEELMESENFDGLFLHQIIEESIIDACTTGDDKLIEDLEEYIKIVESEEYDPEEKFEESLSESLYPYFENNARIYGSFLLEEPVEYMKHNLKQKDGETVTKRPGLLKRMRQKIAGNKFARSMKSGFNKVKSGFKKVKGGVRSGFNKVKSVTRAGISKVKRPYRPNKSNLAKKTRTTKMRTATTRALVKMR